METLFRLDDVYNITDVGTVVVGEILRGTLKVGMQININGQLIRVKGIEMNHKEYQEAGPGSLVGVNIEGVSVKIARYIKGKTVSFTDQEGGSFKFEVNESNATNSSSQPIDTGTASSSAPKPNKPIGLLGSIKQMFRK